MEFVLVEWNDAAQLCGEHDMDEVKELGLAHTFSAGILLAETDESFVLARDYFDDKTPSARDSLAVPKVMVKNIRRFPFQETV